METVFLLQQLLVIAVCPDDVVFLLLDLSLLLGSSSTLSGHKGGHQTGPGKVILQLLPAHHKEIRHMVEQLARQGQAGDPTKGFHKDRFGRRIPSDKSKDKGTNGNGQTGAGSIDQYQIRLDLHPHQPKGKGKTVQRGKDGGPIGLSHFPAAWDVIRRHSGTVKWQRVGIGLDAAEAGGIRLGQYQDHGRIPMGVQVANQVEHFGSVTAGSQHHQRFERRRLGGT